MHCRLFWLFFLVIFVKQGVAEESDAWDCGTEKGGEWQCVPQSQSTAESIKPARSNKVQESTAVVTPLFAKPIPARPTPAYTEPPKTAAQKSGWSCAAVEEEETWRCNLVGSDPQGKTKAIVNTQTASVSSLFLSPAFDVNQEQVFESLHSQLAFDPWENCASASMKNRAPAYDTDLRDIAEMDVTADYTEVFDREITSFLGNVKISRADQSITANKASYDAVSDTMDAQGNVFYKENEISLYSETSLLNLGSNEARMRNALFILPTSLIRGAADVVYRDSKTLSRYKNAVFTSCRPGNQDWALHTNRLKMNKETGKAAAKHAWLEFKGVPVMYTPYISFPLDDRRVSGILPPTWGSTDKNGYDIVLPYYWNIAPNYDLTVWPRYLSKRGGMLGGEFRYLTEMFQGSLGLEFLPYDTLRQEPRYSGSFKNEARLTANIASSIDVNYVSDDEYFDELNNALGLSNDRHLRSQADIRYEQEGISFVARAEAYQTIDRNITSNARPYQKLPQVNLDLEHSFEQWPVDLEMNNEYIHFFRNGRVSGHRFNTKPSIAFPLETAASYIKPKFSVQHTEYQLYNYQTAGNPDSISRTSPIFSVDSGLFLEKSFELMNSKYLHTIEPRLFYLYIPNQDQTDIPIFDSSLYDFSYSSLFRENRFSSVDRVQDANQITVAMTTRLIDSQTGMERLNLSVGEIFYFRDRHVTLSGAPETNSLSNLVAEITAQLTDTLSFKSSIQWNPDINDVARGQAEIRYREADRIINLSYRYRRDNFNVPASIVQTDASFRWPIYDNWYGVGRWQYSLKFNSTKESFLGLEKESCCWRFRIIWRRFANILSNSPNTEMDEGIFVQLELKGLTSFGDKVDDFLEKNLNGYRREQ